MASTNNTIANAAPLEWSALWAALDATPDTWMATTESMYWEMLEAVPPRAQARGAFLVGEALRHDSQGVAVYHCFKQCGREYFARNMTVEQFKAGAL
jgi:hypothetical protein